MFETILIIIICVVLLSGIGDLIFDALGFGVKLFLSAILIIASVWLGIKLLFAMIPWMFGICLIAFIVGIIWLVRVVVKRV